MHRSRGRAVLYAIGSGMFLGCGITLVLIGIAGTNMPVFGGEGAASATFLIVNAIPGTLLLGLLFCAPTGMALVFSMARLMRWRPLFGAAWLWGLAGIVFASPIIWLFGAMFAEQTMELPSVHTTLMGYALACGLMARWGYRLVPNQIAPRNPANTAS